MFLVMQSSNAKVGDVAAAYAPIASTCPSTCKRVLRVTVGEPL